MNLLFFRVINLDQDFVYLSQKLNSRRSLPQVDHLQFRSEGPESGVETFTRIWSRHFTLINKMYKVTYFRS